MLNTRCLLASYIMLKTKRTCWGFVCTDFCNEFQPTSRLLQINRGICQENDEWQGGRLNGTSANIYLISSSGVAPWPRQPLNLRLVKTPDETLNQKEPSASVIRCKSGVLELSPATASVWTELYSCSRAAQNYARKGPFDVPLIIHLRTNQERGAFVA